MMGYICGCRFNQAPTDGYEAYVGRKTTFEGINASWLKQLLALGRSTRWDWRSRATNYVMFELAEPWAVGSKTASQLSEKERWMQRTIPQLREMHPDKEIYIMNPEFVSWAYELYLTFQTNFRRGGMGKFSGEKPMSGLFAILFALQICDTVDIYGFEPYKDGLTNQKYHYFDDAKPRPGSHSFDLAHYIYQVNGKFNPPAFLFWPDFLLHKCS